MINYIQQPFEMVITLKYPPNRNISGYGSKIPTQYMIIQNNKRYRVYAICYSNCASHYIIQNKQHIFLRDSDFIN